MSSVARGILLSASAANRPHPLIENIRLDGAQLLPETLSFATIRDCGFKGSVFDRINFHSVTFANCYFRSAVFSGVQFNACRFIDCNFREARFRTSTLDYSEFEGTHLSFDQVKNLLPERHNVRMFLARSLKANSLGVGDVDDARSFLLVELRASMAFNFGKAFMWTHHFYRKYSFTQKLRAFWTVLWLGFSDIIWGHGEKPGRVGIVAAVTIGVFAWIFSWPAVSISTTNSKALPGIWDYLEFSLGSFINSSFGHWTPAGMATSWVAHLEGVLGLILFGFLVAALFRRFSRR